MLYTCLHCGLVKTTLYKYSKHLRLYHESSAKFNITCNIQGCKDTFTVVRCFVRHVGKKHAHVPELEIESGNAQINLDGDCNVDNSAVGSYADTRVDEKFSRKSLDQTVNDFEKHVAQCILKLREKHILPVSVQQDIVDEMQLMVSQVHDTYQSVFTTFCEEQNISSPYAGMGQFMEQKTSLFDDVFKNINSDYKLNKFICSNFTFVKPQEIVLGHKSTGKPAVFSYISVSSVLKLMLSNDDIRHQVLSGNTVLPCTDALGSFTDGNIYKDHTFFSEHPNGIRLHFYLDEFEVCNPLGSKRGKHKVLAVYYLVGNLNCKYWSEMKFIHLCILVRYQQLREFDPTYTQVLKPLIDELNTLSSDGVDVTADGVTYNFRAGLATVSGDNLSAHSLGGFQHHFNDGRICRFCMANYDEIGTKLTEASFVVRNKEVHTYHLDALQSNAANGPVYGVLNRCPFLDLPYFDVTKAFVPDIMHDMLEGVIPHLMHKLLHKSVREKAVTIDVLNKRLDSVSKCTNDRPNAFTTRNLGPSGNVVGSASQKWQLFLILPQILGRYLDEGDLSWETYLLLRDVTDIVFAPVIRKSSLSFLEGLIVQFLSHYALVFGAQAITPKHHYMLHYPRLIGMYGPLRHLWCMRFESKHQYFKSVISSLGNYINVTSTMASRHQMRQCWEFTCGDILSCEPYPVGRTRVLQMSDLPSDLRSTIATRLEIEVCVTDQVTSAKQLRRDHVTYTVDSCIAVCIVEEEEIPVYFIIKYIILYCDTWLLCGRLCFCQQLNRHLHAFSVNVDGGWAVVHPGEEADYSLHDLFIVDGCSFVNSKYHVPMTCSATTPPHNCDNCC